MNIAKAMIGLRDTAAFQAKAIELQSVIAEVLGKLVEAHTAELAQSDRIHALEAEVADLKAWGAEKERYELKQIGSGAFAYMLKPNARGSEPPHWLCPNCYAQGKKSFLQRGERAGRDWIYRCTACGDSILDGFDIKWID